MKKITSLLLTAAIISAFVLIFATPAYGASSYIVDNASVIDDSSESDLSGRMQEVAEKHSIDMVVVTVQTTEGKYYVDYADDYYDQHGYGKDGVLLLIVMEYEFDGYSSVCYISTAGKCINYISEDDAYDIESDVAYYLHDRDFSAAIITFASGCDSAITSAKNINPMVFVVAVIVGLIVAAVFTGKLKKQLKSVRAQPAASTYVKNGSMQIRESREMFLYRTVSRRPRDTDRGGRGGSHTSSEGVSHGGGRGHGF